MTFGTIFLGLVVGVQPISVLVGESVAAVEILIDGGTAAVVRGEPWSVEIDFGWRLAPHELEAVAFDGEGREVGRARQLVNVPRPLAQASLFMSSENGRRLARLTWEAVEGAADPQAIRVYLDGELQEVPDPTRIELPVDDDDRLHFLRAEVDFTEAISAVAELTYGGFYADRVNTDLTALPVLLAKGSELPPPEQLEGWIRGPRGEVRVVAMEKGTAEILMVRSASAVAPLQRWFRLRSGARRLSGMFNVRSQARGAFVWPHAEPTRGRTRQFWVFPFSPSYSLSEITLVDLARLERQPEYPPAQQRLTDALAVAGMAAAQRHRRRAVILILAKGSADHSGLLPAQATDYLRQLHVPLFVWAVDGVDPEMKVWGEVFDTSSRSGMLAAVHEVDRTLAAQRILWVDGVFLPNQLSLGKRAVGLSLISEGANRVEEAGVLTLQ